MKLMHTFGENVFNDSVMQKLLPNDVYLAVKNSEPMTDAQINLFAEALR